MLTVVTAVGSRHASSPPRSDEKATSCRREKSAQTVATTALAGDSPWVTAPELIPQVCLAIEVDQHRPSLAGSRSQERIERLHDAARCQVFVRDSRQECRRQFQGEATLLER